MDNAHAVLARVRNGVDFDRFAVDADFSVVLGVNAAEDVDERGFSRAVFADQREHFARLEVQAHAAQRVHAGKALMDIVHFQQVVFQCRSLLTVSCRVLRQKENDDNMIIAESGIKFDDAHFSYVLLGINLE